jgi:hypothetical protein
MVEYVYFDFCQLLRFFISGVLVVITLSSLSSISSSASDEIKSMRCIITVSELIRPQLKRFTIIKLGCKEANLSER